MKKLSLILSLVAFMMVGLQVPTLSAQEDTTEQVQETEAVEETPAAPPQDLTEEDKEEVKGRQLLLEKFLQGGAFFMSIVLIVLIFGLAFCIERLISLMLVSTNAKKLLQSVEDKLAQNDVDGAMEVCKANRSPIASIMYQGLARVDGGVDVVEKNVIANGSVEMGRLERGLSWISLAIALAPMLGFMGTIIGMIGAFESIEVAGDISPTIVAGDIKVALLTTLFGLIVAVILQVFYNYIVSRIDSIVNDMEDASITFVDMLLENNIVEKAK